MTLAVPSDFPQGIGLVGRTEELEQLRRALAAAIAQGATKVVVVSGEAGLGKTTLLQAFRAEVRAQTDQPVCGYGQALSVGVATEAFGAVRECLRSIVSSRGDVVPPHFRAIGDALKSSAPAWLEAIPLVGQLLSAGVQTSHALAHGRSAAVLDLASPVDQFVTFVAALAAKTPVVLVLDDLHWADNATVELAMRLALQNVGPLLLVLSYRVTPGTALTDADRAIREARNNILRYKADASTIDLRRLPDESLVQALGARLESERRTLPPQDLRRVVHLAGGNPLLAECLLVSASGADELTALSGFDEVDRIGAIMDIGLSRLDPTESRFLEACATVGPIFDAADVGRASNLFEDDVLDQIDLLSMKASLIVDVPGQRGIHRYKFHHPILAEVLRERAKGQFNRWRRMNDRLANETQHLDVESSWDAALLARMAGYAVEAELHAEAFRWALAASKKQLALGSSSTALGTAKAALASAETSSDRLAARLILIECLQAYADYDEVVRACEAALGDLGGADPANSNLVSARIRLQRARGLRMSGDWARVATDLPALVEDCSAWSAPLHAQARLLLAETQLCGPQQDLDGCTETLRELLSGDLDVATRSRAIGHLGLTALARHEPATAQGFLEEAILLGKQSERPFDEYEAVHWLSKKQMACLELTEAARSIGRLQEISETYGIAGDTPFHDRDLSRVLGLFGDQEEAARLCVRYIDSSGSTDGIVISTLAFQLAELAEIRGRDVSVSMAKRLIDLAPGHMYDSSRRDLASRAVRLLLDAADIVAVANDPSALDVVDADHRNASDVFRFNVPDLNRLRQSDA